MKKHTIILFVFLLSSCTILKRNSSDVNINGIIFSKNKVGDTIPISGVNIYFIASYSRYPIPNFCLDCFQFIELENKLNKNFLFKSDNAYKFLLKILETKSDSLGRYSVGIPIKIIKKTWPQNNSYPKYEYLMFVFKKVGYKTKIKIFAPNCDSIMNSFKMIELEPVK